MPCCYITDEATGAAAAMAARDAGDTRSINIGEWQARRMRMGTYLPNVKEPPQ